MKENLSSWSLIMHRMSLIERRSVLVLIAGYERPLSIFKQETWRQSEIIIEAQMSPSVKSQNAIFFLVPRESMPVNLLDENVFCNCRSKRFIFDV
jgi:hypothetical protein